VVDLFLFVALEDFFGVPDLLPGLALRLVEFSFRLGIGVACHFAKFLFNLAAGFLCCTLDLIA
jgi:hypothetical protein